MAQLPPSSLHDDAWAHDPNKTQNPEQEGELSPISESNLPSKRWPVGGTTADSHLEDETDAPDKRTEKAAHPTTQSSTEVPIEEQKIPPPISLYGKLGALTTAILIGGTICIATATGFLWFLWLADYSNSAWHHIVYNNWFTRCVSLSGLVIRTAVSLQASAATSMLASLALERTGVLLLHFASVSLTRHSNGGPYMLAWWLLKTFIRSPQRWANAIVPALITVLTILTIAIQFTTTVLLSDVNSIVIPGLSNELKLATNFAYTNGTIPVVTRGTTWIMKPPFYPVFAEYHEDAPETPDGVSDTGLTLRAFVPLQVQQSRAQLKDYSGRATVLDSRVVCMRPNLTTERAHVSDSMLALAGNFTAAFNASRLEFFSSTDGKTTLTDWDARLVTEFTCLGLLNYTERILGNVESGPSVDEPHWRLSICQPSPLGPEAGVLMSEFRTLEDVARGIPPTGLLNYANGDAYIVMNISSGTADEWLLGLSDEISSVGVINGPGSVPRAYSDHGEWLDLVFSEDASLRLSVSLCYTAFDTADLDISMYGAQNRTEPVSNYDIGTSAYTYGAIREQYGQFPDGRISYANDEITTRGILSLNKRPSWLPGSSDYFYNGDTSTGGVSWITDFANMAGPTVLGAVNLAVSGSFGSDITAFMYNGYREPNSWTSLQSINPDPSMISLVQEIIQNGGSIAFAMQSIVTSLSSTAYYDQLQQFNDVNTISYSEFIVATARAKFRGLIAVSAVIVAHLLLMGGVACLFLVRAKLSSVGNSWQAVAQVKGEMTGVLLETAAFETDAEVGGVLKARSWESKIVGIGVFEDGGKMSVGLRDGNGIAISATGFEGAV